MEKSSYGSVVGLREIELWIRRGGGERAGLFVENVETGINICVDLEGVRVEVGTENE